MEQVLDLYTDYLLSSSGKTTAAGLSQLLDGHLSRDKTSRLLSGNDFTSKDLWHHVKSPVRSHETEDACLIFDGTIIGKPYTDEKRKEKRQSVADRNEMLRSMISQSIEQQHLMIKYVLSDSWFSSSDNMLFIHRSEKYFLMDMKSSRPCMYAASGRNKGRWSSLDKLPLTPEHPVKVWLKGMEIPVLLCKPVFTDRDGSTGEMYPVTNNLEPSTDEFRILYKKRWSMEEYHKSLKQNASLAKSPCRLHSK